MHAIHSNSKPIFLLCRTLKYYSRGIILPYDFFFFFNWNCSNIIFCISIGCITFYWMFIEWAICSCKPPWFFYVRILSCHSVRWFPYYVLVSLTSYLHVCLTIYTWVDLFSRYSKEEEIPVDEYRYRNFTYLLKWVQIYYIIF